MHWWLYIFIKPWLSVFHVYRSRSTASIMLSIIRIYTWSTAQKHTHAHTPTIVEQLGHHLHCRFHWKVVFTFLAACAGLGKEWKRIGRMVWLEWALIHLTHEPLMEHKCEQPISRFQLSAIFVSAAFHFANAVESFVLGKRLLVKFKSIKSRANGARAHTVRCDLANEWSTARTYTHTHTFEEPHIATQCGRNGKSQKWGSEMRWASHSQTNATTGQIKSAKNCGAKRCTILETTGPKHFALQIRMYLEHSVISLFAPRAIHRDSWGEIARKNRQPPEHTFRVCGYCECG